MQAGAYVRSGQEFNALESAPAFDSSHEISDHHQSWGYEDGPSKGPGPSLLVVADF
jgi:hypothetical protein